MTNRVSRGFGLIEVSLGVAVGAAALVGAVMTFSHMNLPHQSRRLEGVSTSRRMA